MFEITENVMIARSAHVVLNSIDRLKEWSGLISLDDFGTGYGSLKHLLELPVDEIKIDQSFVAGIGSDLASEVILDAILHMAKGLGAHVVAEGVEEQAQADYLAARDCDAAQGYLFSPAVRRGAVDVFLSNDEADFTFAAAG